MKNNKEEIVPWKWILNPPKTSNDNDSINNSVNTNSINGNMNMGMNISMNAPMAMDRIP